MPTPPRSLVLWDVDHTLIENGGVSKENYALAFELVTGRAPERRASTDGRTDVGIMSALLSDNGIGNDRYSVDEQLAALVEAGGRNAARIAERGHALHGAAECLAQLAADPSLLQSVMTGNVEPNARVKLGAFGLDQWLDWTVSLDDFTVKHLRRYVARIDAEREAFAESYAAGDELAVGPEGLPVHPDTLTRRFNRLVDRAGVPRIRLHDVRHTYATLAMDAGVDPKMLSDRIGHANTGITLQVYTHRSTGKDRPLAEQMSAIIEAALELDDAS